MAIHRESMSLYSNVMHVWTTALATMESLVSGGPHEVRDGPILLGLSAWHIFPDMVVFNSGGSTAVKMNDILVKPGGVLSLGTSGYGGQGKGGVYWSLSLAHHTFYGEAASRTRRLDSDGSRMSLSELVLVCLGCLLRGWSIPVEDMGEAFRVLQAIPHYVPTDQGNTGPRDWSWFYDPRSRTVSFGTDPKNSYGYLSRQKDGCEHLGHRLIREHAAIYCKGHEDPVATVQALPTPKLTFQDVLWCFQSGFIDPDRLREILESEPCFGFLKVLAAVCELYKEPSAGGATTSSAIVDAPFQPILRTKLDQVEWTRADGYVKVNRHAAISLIGYFETTSNIIEDVGEDDVRIIGLSGGDSIFILTATRKINVKIILLREF
ncbi:hypothetical protein F4810DRAFT_716089 [Camillea tinctor]|nr:hypothetical protein F4810DRAFT_716089 [Camillea tinctor]